MSGQVRVVIVTPALADANNGNWRTAQRWGRFLAPLYSTRLVKNWPDGEGERDQVMIALHARRSASSIAAWREHQGRRPLAVVLTGTDLYRDIHADAAAQNSLASADQLVVLQERGLAGLLPEHRAKARVIFQSASERAPRPKTARHLRALMVGHLREEKTPPTLFAATRMIDPAENILIDHIGAPIDQALADMAQATMALHPHYRWLGNRAHEETRRRIRDAHVLVHCSQIEGGSHVILEAAVSGTPVLASNIEGNVGLLGETYGGYFPWGDAGELVRLLRDCRASQDDPAARLQSLARQIVARAPLFVPARERLAVRRLVTDLIGVSD